MSVHLVDLTVAFALITGTGAGVLALLSWEIFRQSPVGRAVFALVLMMSVFVVYHAVVFSFGEDLVLSKFLMSSVYTILVVFIGLMVDAQRRVARNDEVGGGNR